MLNEMSLAPSFNLALIREAVHPALSHYCFAYIYRVIVLTYTQETNERYHASKACELGQGCIQRNG